MSELCQNTSGITFTNPQLFVAGLIVFTILAMIGSCFAVESRSKLTIDRDRFSDDFTIKGWVLNAAAAITIIASLGVLHSWCCRSLPSIFRWASLSWGPPSF